jgi:hypothetical protein
LSWTDPSAPASVLALVTTLHLALASLRNHRRPNGGAVSSLAAVSLLLAGLPWILPSHAGLVAGIVLHGIWFGVCERWTPRVELAATAAPGQVPARRPSPPPSLPASAEPAVVTTTPAAPRGFVDTTVLAVVEEATDFG